MMGHIISILLFLCQNIVIPGILLILISIDINIHQIQIHLKSAIPPKKYDLAKHMQLVFPQSQVWFCPRRLVVEIAPTDLVETLKCSYKKCSYKPSGINVPTKLVVEGFPQAQWDEPTIVNLALCKGVQQGIVEGWVKQMVG